VRRQRLDDPLAQTALEHMLGHLETLDAQLAAVDRQLADVAASQRWCDPVRWLSSFRGISTLTALALLAEIGDFRRFATARELMSFLGLTVAEYSSGDRRSRGSLTKTGNRPARRLLVEAAWHYRHPPRRSSRLRANEPLLPPELSARAWQAQTRLYERQRHLSNAGKLATVTNAAIARELCGFIWATMTRQPLRDTPTGQPDTSTTALAA
jgi:transposase